MRIFSTHASNTIPDETFCLWLSVDGSWLQPGGDYSSILRFLGCRDTLMQNDCQVEDLETPQI